MRDKIKKCFCKRCNKKFQLYISQIIRGMGKYCSRKCHHIDIKGISFSPKTQFKKEHNPWNKGIKIQINTGRTHFKKGHRFGRRFKKGIIPFSKLHPECMPIGEKNHNWKGGRRISNGYISIKSPTHPFKGRCGYVREHRLVMEDYLGRYLKPEEVVHHINNIHYDNRIENLKLFPNESAHQKFHRPQGIAVTSTL